MSNAQTQGKMETPKGFRKILVATDFTPRAELAIQRALRLPLSDGGRVVLAHILPRNIPSKYREAVKRQGGDSLRGLASRMSRNYQETSAAAVTVVPVIREGIAYDEIIRLSSSEKPELIVIGRHGQRAIRDLLLGSTAEKIIRKANLPVLTVNRKASAPYARAAIALELADSPARRTIELTIRILGLEATEITLVHALNVPFEQYIADAQLEVYRRECEERATSKISGILKKVGDEIQWNVAVKRGDPRIVLLKAVKEAAADLIVLGTRGASGISRALIGSVAEYILRSVQCDVLVVPRTP